MVKKFHFKGLMCPTFTAFNEDKQVNYDIIDKYRKLLKDSGVNGALINGTSGEGSCLRVDERKRLAELWQVACKKYGVTLMVQIGGTDILSVYELAKHAEEKSFESVLCLPELFFKPKIEEDLVDYIKNLARFCPTTPFYYYHNPRSSGVDLNMSRFYDLVEKKVPNVRGLKYTNGDMEIAVDLIKEDSNILLGADTILWGGLNLGFDAAIMTSLNVCADVIREIHDSFINNKPKEGYAAQLKLNHRIKEILSQGTGEWVECMKMEFNRVNTTFKAGTVRRPKISKRGI